MLTSVQKEILQNLINLYQSSNGKSIKGDDIAEVMDRNSGTIRNQMQSLRSLGLVKGVPGPHGGYKPTVEAYQFLNITSSENESKVSMFLGDKKLEDVSVAKIEFTSIPNPGECEAAVKVLGNIRNLNLGETIRIGPTHVNNLGIVGKIVGRDDMDNIILLDTKTIRSIPKNEIKDISSFNLISLKPGDSLRDASKILVSNHIDGAPVIENNKAIGVFTVTDIVQAIASGKENLKVKDLMSDKVITIKKDVKIVNALDRMIKEDIGRLVIVNSNDKPIGIVTRTDMINSIINLDEFPVVEPEEE